MLEVSANYKTSIFESHQLSFGTIKVDHLLRMLKDVDVDEDHKDKTESTIHKD